MIQYPYEHSKDAIANFLTFAEANSFDLTNEEQFDTAWNLFHVHFLTPANIDGLMFCENTLFNEREFNTATLRRGVWKIATQKSENQLVWDDLDEAYIASNIDKFEWL